MILVNIPDHDKSIMVYEAEKTGDILKLVEKIAYEIKWRYNHDHDNNGKRFNHNYANYPISFDIETSSFYNFEGDFLTNDQKDEKLNEIYENSLKIYKKDYKEKKANNKATIDKVRAEERFEKCACMYLWQMAFGTNDTVIIGRTWQSWIDLLAQLKCSFGLDERRSMIIYIHNLRHEMSYIKSNFYWDEKRTFLSNDCVYYATPNKLYYGDPEMPRGFGTMPFTGFMFKDSLILSGVKLENLSELMVKYADKCYKLSGYDYDKVRHSETPLTNDEIAYGICDVLSLNWYIREKMEEPENVDDKGPNLLKVALTETQELKRVCKDKLYYSNPKYKNPNNYKFVKYHKFMDEMKFDFAVYQQIRRAFQGGFVHANRIHIGEVFYDEIMSCDIKSSYPAAMVMSNEYPISSYEKVDFITKNDFNYYISNFSCLFDVTLYDVRPKMSIDPDLAGTGCVDLDFDYIDQIISTYKVEEFGNIYPNCKPIYPPSGDYGDDNKWYKNNGRLRYAERISLTVNHLDWKAICRFYDFDKSKVKVDNFRIAKKGYLPKPLIEYVIELFRNKCMNEKDSFLYKVSKRRLNSLFGMIAYNILKEQYKLDENNEITKKYTGLSDDELNEALEAELEAQTNFLCYQWSTILTSEARLAVFRIISEGSKYNHVYTDTDSEKFIKNDLTIKWIQIYNDDVDVRMNKCFKFYGLPKDWHKVNSPEGQQCLGHFVIENEGKPYKKFTTSGAKRYIYEDEKGNHITCSGLTKTAIKYLEEKYGDDLYRVFGEGNLEVDKEHSGRLVATYGDSIKGVVIDYLGNKAKFSEVGYCHMEKTSYNMKLCDDFEKIEDLVVYQSFDGAGGL